jgi:Mrp family chromosome partitioning ATPase
VNIVFDGRLRGDSAPPMVQRPERRDVPRPIANVTRPYFTHTLTGLLHYIKTIPRAVPKLAETWMRDDAPDHLDLKELTRQEEIKLVHRLFLQSGSDPRRIVLFTGVERDNGCAAICARAGKTLAALEPGSVCVVDANLRLPVLHQHVGGTNQHGFATTVEQSGSASLFAQRLSPDNLWLLSAGSSGSDPERLLTVDRVAPRMRELGGSFEYVLLYAPPINLYAESLALSRFVDGVVLVVEANTTRRETVRDMKTRLELLNVPVLGIVLNDRTFPIPETVYRRL